MDPITSNFLMTAAEPVPATVSYVEGFVNTSAARATTYTFNLTSSPSSYRWALITMKNGQAATGTQHPITFTIDGTTTFLGNVGNVTVGNGVSNDGNASASSYVSQTLVRIPTQSTISVRGDWNYSSGGQLAVAVLQMPALFVTHQSSVSADAGDSNDPQNVTEVNNGVTIGGFTGTYGTWSAITWISGLNKFPISNANGIDLMSLSYVGPTTAGVVEYNLSYTSTDSRARIFSHWAMSF